RCAGRDHRAQARILIMSIFTRILLTGALAGIVVPVSAAAAQRGATGRSTGPGRPPSPSKAQQQTDTTKKKNAPPSAVALDFQDQELRVVLDAIAAAGQLNVAFSNIPQRRVTMHMGKPVPREEMGELLKSYAESEGLKVTMTPTLIQIAGTQAVDNARQQQADQARMAQQLLQQNQQQQVRLFTLRLKHASAVQLAPVLSNLFGGFTSGTTNFTFGR